MSNAHYQRLHAVGASRAQATFLNALFEAQGEWRRHPSASRHADVLSNEAWAEEGFTGRR